MAAEAGLTKTPTHESTIRTAEGSAEGPARAWGGLFGASPAVWGDESREEAAVLSLEGSERAADCTSSPTSCEVCRPREDARVRAWVMRGQ